jgi:hypothetical protein
MKTLVGRTPSSAADAHVGLLVKWKETPKSWVLGDPRGPGGPPHWCSTVPTLVSGIIGASRLSFWRTTVAASALLAA